MALDFCRAASIHNNLTSCFFSLEMTRSEIMMRLLSAEAKVPLNHIRNGTMRDDDWEKLARKMGQVSGAPMFIDDSPNMTMMEIRAKARRLKQRHDLKLIVIDYMQLMSSGKKVESRQLEVSEFSRNIKLLAKELEIPIIALSQLNRGPEQRTRQAADDERPSRVRLPDRRHPVASRRHRRRGDPRRAARHRDPGRSLCGRWTIDSSWFHARSPMPFPAGARRPSGSDAHLGPDASRPPRNHPFLTLDGWMPLGELTGDRVGVLRHVPPPLSIVAA